MAAGLGFKTFTTGDVLTAGDVNGYLMQGVLVFSNAAARSAAITSPQEGQFSFLKDTNSTEYYDGTAWVASGGGGGGKVLQVVMGTTSTSTTIASTSFTDTSLTASITPSSTSSKVLVFYAQQYKSFRGQSTQGVGLQLVRNSTAIQTIGGAKYAAFTWDGVSTGGAEFRTVTTSTYLDSPSTTSSTTYKVQGGVLYTSNSGEMVCQNDSPSTIILMEIGA